jgi:teichoic acid transport system permease protein
VIIAFKRFVPTIVIYVPVHLAMGLPVGPEQLWVLPLMALLVVLASGLAMIVAALQVYFRDLKNFMPYLLRVWLYGSPVLYYADEMPQQYRFLLDVNPLGQLLAAWSGVINQAQAPTSHQLVVASAWAFGFLAVGFLYFVSRERDFAVRL